MIGREHRMSTTDPRSRAVLARNAALVRIRRTRRWVIAGTAALTAGFAALVAALAPGRSLASKSPAATEVASAGGKSATGASGRSATGARTASSVPQLPPAASPGSLGLQGPSQPPQAASGPPQSQSAPSSPPPQSQPQSAPSSPQPQPQPQSAPSSPQSSAPTQSTPPVSAPQPAAQPSSGGGGVVSGGS
jgi:hypothetical protein